MYNTNDFADAEIRWKSVSKDRFPKLKDFALEIHLIF